MDLERTIGLLMELDAGEEVPDDAAVAYGCFLACRVMLESPRPPRGTRIKSLPPTAPLATG